jgi:hypothetical protein
VEVAGLQAHPALQEVLHLQEVPTVPQTALLTPGNLLNTGRTGNNRSKNTRKMVNLRSFRME